MKIRPLSRAEVRDVDRIAIEQYGISGVVLMENAGAGAAQIIQTIAPPGRIVILCGKGNNGGDGYVIARHLDQMGCQVTLVSVVDTDELTGDAKTNFQIAERSGLLIKTVTHTKDLQTEITAAQTIVDCLLGTGATGPLRGLYDDAVRLSNAHSATRIAIDVPTGLDCDSGETSTNTFRAHTTITFVAKKLAMKIDKSHPFVGNVHIVSIGVPRCLLEAFASDEPRP